MYFSPSPSPPPITASSSIPNTAAAQRHVSFLQAQLLRVWSRRDRIHSEINAIDTLTFLKSNNYDLIPPDMPRGPLTSDSRKYRDRADLEEQLEAVEEHMEEVQSALLFWENIAKKTLREQAAREKRALERRIKTERGQPISDDEGEEIIEQGRSCDFGSSSCGGETLVNSEIEGSEVSLEVQVGEFNSEDKGKGRERSEEPEDVYVDGGSFSSVIGSLGNLQLNGQRSFPQPNRDAEDNTEADCQWGDSFFFSPWEQEGDDGDDGWLYIQQQLRSTHPTSSILGQFAN